MTIVGIIGGTGKMGVWLTKFFESKGYEVIVSGRKTKLTNKELVKKSDIVIISVPIIDTVKIIEDVIGETREGQLLMDITSLKTDPVNAMLKSKAEVIGLHPMFNQTVKSFEGQTLVFCPSRADKWEKEMYSLFKEAGAVVKKTTPEEHDRMMAIIQGVIHFSIISLGHAFKGLGLDIRESLNFSSPIYKMRFDMIGRIMAQDPELYAHIELLNPRIDEVLKVYFESMDDLREIVNEKNIEKFIEYFQETSDYFGDFKDEAMKSTNFMISQIVRDKR